MRLFNINGEVNLAGSKSILNRVIILGSHLKQPLQVINWSTCNDIRTMEDNLNKIGFRFIKEANNCVIKPPKRFKNNQNLFIKDSAAGFRFLLARLAFEPGLKDTIILSDQLNKRPHDLLINLLGSFGVGISKEGNRIILSGIKFQGGDFTLPGTVSSQYTSALLLATCANNKAVGLSITDEMVSKSYVELTLEVMRWFSVKSSIIDNKIVIDKEEKLINPKRICVEPDCSSAAFWWTLGALNKGNLFVKGITEKSYQPDIKMISILEKLGAIVSTSEKGLAVGYGKLLGGRFDLTNNPDLAPLLSVIGLFCKNPLTLTGIEHLKYKESDRMATLIEQLSKIGGEVKSGESEITIYPLLKEPRNVVIDTKNDHRMVMAFTLLKKIFSNIQLSETHSISKSYPEFFQDLKEHDL